MMGQILSAAGKAGIRLDLGEIRLLRVLAGHRHSSAQAKAIFHQVTRMWTTQGIGNSESMDARAFIVTYVVKLPTSWLVGSNFQEAGLAPTSNWPTDPRVVAACFESRCRVWTPRCKTIFPRPNRTAIGSVHCGLRELGIEPCFSSAKASFQLSFRKVQVPFKDSQAHSTVISLQIARATNAPRRGGEKC